MTDRLCSSFLTDPGLYVIFGVTLMAVLGVAASMRAMRLATNGHGGTAA